MRNSYTASFNIMASIKGCAYLADQFATFIMYESQICEAKNLTYEV